ncbi:MAG: hypothetical protein J6U33_00965 [Paludibacteraceae bacterium]|nr:hypothetical protein [Paludibacteraceae bacterium]
MWTQPKGKGFDKNQIGIGLDRNNKFVKRAIPDWEHAQLTAQKEREIRLRYIEELTRIYDKYVDANLHFSEKRKAIALGLMYHGMGPHLWTNHNDGLYESFWDGSDDDFENAVTKFYDGTFTERSQRHKAFWDA